MLRIICLKICCPFKNTAYEKQQQQQQQQQQKQQKYLKYSLLGLHRIYHPNFLMPSQIYLFSGADPGFCQEGWLAGPKNNGYLFFHFRQINNVHA